MQIRVPCNYLRTDVFWYTEGNILTIAYPDSSSIRILCGSNATIELKELSERNSKLFYKKVNVKGHELIYEDVPKNMVRIFDRAFDLLETDIK